MPALVDDGLDDFIKLNKVRGVAKWALKALEPEVNYNSSPGWVLFTYERLKEILNIIEDP